ncbi:MAG: hypothetical protein PVJ39_01815 [Gammaproteobacteria bacterium]|jgi:hypothetical protein
MAARSYACQITNVPSALAAGMDIGGTGYAVYKGYPVRWFSRTVTH